jgi:hypothetical protein
MKLSSAFLLLAPAAAFTPGATFSRPTSAVPMSTEAAAETKVGPLTIAGYLGGSRKRVDGFFVI